MELTQKVKQYDLLGATASGLCVIHCTFTPIFLSAKPMIQSSMESHQGCTGIWAAFDYIFLALSFIAVWYSSRHTDHKTVTTILWMSWILFAAGLLSEAIDFSVGKWLMYAGSIALVITHLINISFCARCNHE